MQEYSHLARLIQRFLLPYIRTLTPKLTQGTDTTVPATAENEDDEYVAHEQKAVQDQNLVQAYLATSDVLEWLGKFCCNAFTICDAEFRPVGLGVFPEAAMINHSCRPNCHVLFDGLRLQLRSIKKLRKEEEVTISYIELASTSAERRAALRNGYFFQCSCPACCTTATDEMHILEKELTALVCPKKDCKESLYTSCIPPSSASEADGDSTQTPGKTLFRCCSCDFEETVVNEDGTDAQQQTFLEGKDHQQRGSKAASPKAQTIKGASPPPSLAALLDVLAEARQQRDDGNKHRSAGMLKEAQLELETAFSKFNKCAGNTNVERFRVACSLAHLCVDLGDWEKAASYYSSTLPGYKLIYPPNHPLIGLQFAAHGKLALHLNQLKQAYQSLNQAVEILKITHGRAHSLVQELSQLVCQVQIEIQHSSYDLDDLSQ